MWSFWKWQIIQSILEEQENVFFSQMEKSFYLPIGDRGRWVLALVTLVRWWFHLCIKYPMHTQIWSSGAMVGDYLLSSEQIFEWSNNKYVHRGLVVTRDAKSNLNSTYLHICTYVQCTMYIVRAHMLNCPFKN